MVLAELTGRISHRSEHVRDSDGLIGDANGCSSLSNCCKAGPHRYFTSDEVRPPGGAARFRIIVGEAHTLVGHPVQIRGSAGHYSLIVNTDVRPADIVAHDNDDVWLVATGRCWSGCRLLSLRHLRQRT